MFSRAWEILPNQMAIQIPTVISWLLSAIMYYCFYRITEIVALTAATH